METLSPLPDIHEVEPFNEDDVACFEELRAVLMKHGKLTRFGVTLLHDHFPIAEDEILMESCDVATRTLTIQPVAKAEYAKRTTVGTNWRLDANEVRMGCTQVCLPGPDSHGTSHHYTR